MAFSADHDMYNTWTEDIGPIFVISDFDVLTAAQCWSGRKVDSPAGPVLSLYLSVDETFAFDL